MTTPPKTQGRGFLVLGSLAIVAGLLLAIVGLVDGRDELLVRGGLFAVLGLFAVYVGRSMPRR